MLRKIRVSAHNIFLFIIIPVIIACLIYLTWLNHNDFKKTILSDSKEQLLMIAESEAQSIEKHLVALNKEENKIHQLVRHINKAEKIYALVIDNIGTLVVYPDKQHTGENMHAFLQDKLKGADLSQAKTIMRDMSSGKEGVAIINFFSEDLPSKIVKTIIAYSPIHKEGKIWSIAILREFSSVEGPINRNLRDNLIFVSFAILALFIWGLIFFRNQKRNYELKISEKALEIINKQMHLELSEYKRIARELQGPLRIRTNNSISSQFPQLKKKD